MHLHILNFWFNQIDQTKWFKKDEDFDNTLITKYSEIHQQASCCELYLWRQTAKGRLAEILILDQFSRNIFRNTPQAFASDPLALSLAQEAISVGAHLGLSELEKNFLYMPFMHSESKIIHEIAIELFTENGNESTLNYEIKHKNIIDKFGRYPHRNITLNRISTNSEIEFLKSPGSSF